jgi:hypothetical protein
MTIREIFCPSDEKNCFVVFWKFGMRGANMMGATADIGF